MEGPGLTGDAPRRVWNTQDKSTARTNKILMREDIVKPKARRRTDGTSAKGAQNWLKQLPRSAKAWRSDNKTFFEDLVTDSMGPKANLLALVPGRPLFAELAKDLDGAQRYLRQKEEMDALRNDIHGKTDEIAQKWMRLNRRGRRENAQLMDLMHRSTLAGIDPSKDFEPDGRIETAKAEQGRHSEGSAWTVWADQMIAHEAARRASYDTLRTRLLALPKEYQAMFRQVSRAHHKMGDDFEAAVIANIKKATELGLKRAEQAHERELRRIKDEGLTGLERSTALNDADQTLEKARLQTRERAGVSRFQVGRMDP